MSQSGIVLVTGTGTGVGKTTVTAALAAEALADGRRVCVVKPVQTGVGPDEPGDIAEILRLLEPLLAPDGSAGTGRLSTHEFFRLPEALGPQAAARRAGVRLPPLAEYTERISALAEDADLVLVEGAGGLLVRLDGDDRTGGTIADLGLQLRAGPGPAPAAVVVCEAGLGTLSVSELTVEALRHRGVPVVGLVIGSWPAEPGTAEQENLRDLPELTGVPLLGLLPRSPSLPPRLTLIPAG